MRPSVETNSNPDRVLILTLTSHGWRRRGIAECYPIPCMTRSTCCRPCVPRFRWSASFDMCLHNKSGRDDRAYFIPVGPELTRYCLSWGARCLGLVPGESTRSA